MSNSKSPKSDNVQEKLMQGSKVINTSFGFVSPHLDKLDDIISLFKLCEDYIIELDTREATGRV